MTAPTSGKAMDTNAPKAKKRLAHKAVAPIAPINIGRATLIAAMQAPLTLNLPLGSTLLTGSSLVYTYGFALVVSNKLPPTGSRWVQRPVAAS